MSCFGSFPTLKSNILTLRKIKVLDRHAYFRIRSNPEVNKYIDRPVPKYFKEVVTHISILNNLIKNDIAVIWAIDITNENDFIGTIGLRNFNKNRTSAEIGFELHPTFQRKGFMYQALNLVIEYGFDTLKLKSIEAIIHHKNLASKNLVLKAGFKENKIIKDSEQLNCYVLKKNASLL